MVEYLTQNQNNFSFVYQIYTSCWIINLIYTTSFKLWIQTKIHNQQDWKAFQSSWERKKWQCFPSFWMIKGMFFDKCWQFNPRQVWFQLKKFDLFLTSFIQFWKIWSVFVKFDSSWKSLIYFCQVWYNLDIFDPFLTSLM